MKKTKNKKVVKRVATKKLLKKITSPTSDFRIKPLGDRVLVKPFSQEETNTTASGIIIPDTVSQEKPEKGEVIAVGDGKWDKGTRVPVGVKVGDKVVFSRYGYEEVKVDGVEYYIIKEENILAVLK